MQKAMCMGPVSLVIKSDILLIKAAVPLSERLPAEEIAPSIPEANLSSDLTLAGIASDDYPAS